MCLCWHVFVLRVVRIYNIFYTYIRPHDHRHHKAGHDFTTRNTPNVCAPTLRQVRVYVFILFLSIEGVVSGSKRDQRTTYLPKGGRCRRRCRRRRRSHPSSLYLRAYRLAVVACVPEPCPNHILRRHTFRFDRRTGIRSYTVHAKRACGPSRTLCLFFD